MLFQPAILALLLASAASVAMLVGVTPFAVAVLRHWDIRSGSERQLALERRTYLVSALVTLVLATQVVSLLLFVFNADRMATMFRAAMCAVGTLNVNEYGFPALIAQVAVFFAAATWLAVNRTDVQAPDYPLVRVKYGMLLGLGPLLLTAFALQLRYFLGLKADVITSCCARLFSGGDAGLSADLAALPPLPGMTVFYGGLALAVAAAGYTAVRPRASYVLAAASIAAFVTTIAGVISFVSLYVYEHPHHHCPFCLLKAEYAYQGYWIYIPLFVSTAAGLSAGVVQAVARASSVRDIGRVMCGRLAWVAAAGFTIVAVVASLFVLRSHLVLLG
jgi:hypothetical protein